MKLGFNILVLSSLTLSACASTGISEPFSPSNPDAIILGGAKYSYWYLELVDLDKQIATGEIVELLGPDWLDSPKLKGENSELIFGVKKIEPGNYALYSGVGSGWNGVGTVTSEVCFDQLAPVYKIEAGKLNILPNHPSETNSETTAQVHEVQKILQSHPDITSTAVTPETIAIVDYGRRTRKERCKYSKDEKPITILK